MVSAVGERIKTMRQAQGLTVRELAKRFECSPRSIVYWEKGICTPSLYYWSKIQDWLNVQKIAQNVQSIAQVKDTNHPAKDGNFMAAVALVQRCSEASGGLCECPYIAECEKLFNGLAEKCADRLLTTQEYLSFVDKFYELRHKK